MSASSPSRRSGTGSSSASPRAAGFLLCSFGREQHARTGFPLAYCLESGELEALLVGRLRLLAYEAFTEDGEALEGSLWERPARRT